MEVARLRPTAVVGLQRKALKAHRSRRDGTSVEVRVSGLRMSKPDDRLDRSGLGTGVCLAGGRELAGGRG